MTRSLSHGRLAAVAAAIVLALTGCGVLHPGTAADLGDRAITHDQVDELAQALCSANTAGARAQGQAAPELPTRGARESALQVLLETALAHEFGQAERVEADARLLSQALAQNEAGLQLLPEGQRAGFSTVLERYAAGQLILLEIGRSSLEEQGQAEVADEQATAEGQRLLAGFVEGLDVEVDPRYGSFENGTVAPGTASLSVPVSGYATSASRAAPGPTFVASLPASQKCG